MTRDARPDARRATRRARAGRASLGVAAGVVLVLVAACGPTPPPPPPPASPAAQDVVARHDYVRSLEGLPGLIVDGAMQANAQHHADRLAAGSNGCGNLWHSPELAAWYGGSAAAENLACVGGCPADAGVAFDLWLASPAHAANIYGPFARIGVATACNGSVQMVVAHYRSG